MSATSSDAAASGWRALIASGSVGSLVVLLGGVLLHSMSILLLATVLPSIVDEVGGAALMSWTTTAFLASSILAATCTGALTAAFGSRRAYGAGALVFAVGALVCASASSMPGVVAGRFVQGFGGGLLAAVAYVLVRNVYPEALWSRVFAAIASVWSVSVLLGPLIGGAFASYADWRGAFVAVAVLAGLLVVVSARRLPAGPPARERARLPVPAARVALVCLAIAAMSLAAVAQTLAVKATLVAATVAGFVYVLWLDRGSAAPLLPRDAFSVRSGTGLGLWMVLLLSIAFSPLQVFVPLFLQVLHGFGPLTAGYAVASASMAWTVAAIGVTGFAVGWRGRMLIAGPLLMAAGLGGLGWLMPGGPVTGVLLAIALVGAGIGASWAFTAQRVMSAAPAGEEDIAASSVATVQQAGLALGAALAGLVANAAGMAGGLDPAGVARAASWVPASCVLAAFGAVLTGMRLGARR